MAIAGTTLKVGARYRDKEKLRDNSYNFATPVTGSAFANLTLQGNADYTTDRNYAGNYQYGVFTTPAQLAALDLFNAAQFTLSDQPAEYAAGNFTATETITAGYAQVEQRLGAAVSLIGGARVERTKVDYRGFEFNVDDETISPTVGGQSYTDVLPSVNLRWQAAPSTVVRAAWTNSLARPNYYDLVPYRSVSLDDDELSTGNPDLKPTRAMNLDLTAERYFASVGLISGGVFHKQIDDFIYNFTAFNEVDAVTGRTFAQISRPRNGAKARLTGAEVAVQRQLDFLPGVLKGLGVYLNYTYTDSKVEGLDIAGRENEKLPFLGTAKHSAQRLALLRWLAARLPRRRSTTRASRWTPARAATTRTPSSIAGRIAAPTSTRTRTFAITPEGTLLRRGQQPQQPPAALLPGHARPPGAGRVLRAAGADGVEDRLLISAGCET